MPRKPDVRIDISAVARLAKVSPATVSRAMNHPEIVSPATRKKVDSAIRKSGYIRNRAAQAMHGRRSATIGLVVPTIEYTIFAEMVQSFNDAVSEKGFTVLLASYGYDLDLEYAAIRKLLEHRVDGVALIGLEHAPETVTLLERQDVPAISIWNYAPDAPLPCIGADNSEAARLAAEHLLLLGHRRIGLVFPPVAGNDRAAARLAAAEAALAARGIEVPQEWRRRSSYDIAEAKEACLSLLRQGARPTALICGNDVIAQGALHAAARCGVAVPGALSVVGIGDFAGSAQMEPALTTVRIPARQIGRRAGARLIAAISETAEDAPRAERLDVELIMRATTAPPA